MFLNFLFFLSLFSIAEEIELPKFSKEVMEQASEEYQANCTYSKNAGGEMVSSCTTSSDGDTINTGNANHLQNDRVGRSDGITSDYANEKLRNYQDSQRNPRVK